MVALKRATSVEKGRVVRLYDRAAAAIGKLPPARRQALREHIMADLVNELKRRIEKDSRTHYALGQAAGVTPDVLDRFMRDERGITLATAAKLCKVLDLELTTKARSRK